ncbi:MAG: tRNA (adenosine(37)-N6)-dimethylallyltransferase MiaA [Candidatus Cloacimonadaceae bacterium]|nr:tRNA (adenosine(37)-N6)-dimethylallyltransferase MiaA [Candidatus Cloacimonadaceae bacterium]
MIPLITIEGATASGKSALALKLALELGAQIISADSRQIYRYLDIGTAKPSKQELALIPHHLIDIIDPDQSYNAGFFCRDAGRIISDLHQQGIPAIACGGTGFYVRSLLWGLFEIPEIPLSIREALKQRLEMEGQERIYHELELIDASFADRISPSDTQRVLRGLEVFQGTGKTISTHWREQENMAKYRCFRILVDPPRPLLYERINARMDTMVANGLIGEISSLFEMGFDTLSPGLNSLGYKEYMPYFAGLEDLPTCTLIAAQHCRNYAKRQATWYRKCKFDLTIGNDCISMSHITRLIRDFIQG